MEMGLMHAIIFVKKPGIMIGRENHGTPGHLVRDPDRQKVMGVSYE
jgi:hypothetical protein